MRTRHFYTGTHEWSPEWTNLEKTVKFWKAAMKKFHTRIRGRTLRHMMRQANLPEEVLKKTENECKAAWVEAKNKFELFKPNSAKAAEEHRHQLSKLIATRNNTDPDVEHRKLSHNIRQRKLGLKLR